MSPKKKNKKAWHVTTATHNSRYSQRMFDNYVKLGEAIWISTEDEILVTQTIANIIEEDNLNVIAYNICGDYMHILLVCETVELPKIVGKLKGVSSRKYNIKNGITIPAVEETTPSTTATTTARTTRGHVPLSAEEVVPSSSEVASPSPSKQKKKKYNSLWTQKFGSRKIVGKNDLQNVINYIRNNRVKHQLPENMELEAIIEKMTCTPEHAFRTEYM